MGERCRRMGVLALVLLCLVMAAGCGREKKKKSDPAPKTQSRQESGTADTQREQKGVAAHTGEKPESAQTSPSSAAQEEERFTPIGTQKRGEVLLAFAGDVTWQEVQNPYAYLLRQGGVSAAFSPDTLEILRGADFTMLNNEFQYSDRGTPLTGKTFTFRCTPSSAQYLRDLGVDLVSLANNHIFDYGEEAFLDTLDTLSAYGIPYVGAGHNLEEASAPALYEAQGMKIAILNATEIERYENPETRGATDTQGGVFRCLDPTLLCQRIREAKEETDFVIVYVHWGTEKMSTPDALQLEQAKAMEEAGCDLIIGDHPHVLETVDFVGDMPVIYSLGNFFFSARTVDTGVLQVRLDTKKREIASLRFVPMIQSGGVYTLEHAEKQRVLSELQSFSPGVNIDADGYITKK